jgi:positive regulator of sigma E activity
MSAGGSAAGSGLVVGLCLVFLGQQFGFWDLSSLVTGIIYLVVFAVVFAVVFGLFGVWLGARYRRKHSGMTEWQPKPTPPATSSSKSSEPETQ